MGKTNGVELLHYFIRSQGNNARRVGMNGWTQVLKRLDHSINEDIVQVV